VFATGIVRAFCIGIAIPCVASTIFCVFTVSARFSAGHFHVITNEIKTILTLWCFAPINGVTCAVAYRLLAPKRSPAQKQRNTDEQQ
jgi:hypothetical protein